MTVGQRPVGLVGLGHMGWPVGRRLAAGGVALMVHDLDPAKGIAFGGEVGGRVAGSLGELAEGCDVVVLLLPNGAVVRDVVLGTVERLRPGAVVVDMGSSDPGVYGEIEAALAGRQAKLIDAPVSGGVKGAEAGTLTIMAGGNEAAIARVEPLFGMIGQRVFRTGALGSGQAMKALNNLVSAGALILTVEALLVGQRAGLDPALMTEILNVSTGRSNATDQKILPYVLSRRFDSGFALQLMAKDLATARGLAHRTDTPVALSEQTETIVAAALAALGPAADHTAIAQFLEAEVGEVLRKIEEN